MSRLLRNLKRTASDVKDVRFGVRAISYELSLLDRTGHRRRIEFTPSAAMNTKSQSSITTCLCCRPRRAASKSASRAARLRADLWLPFVDELHSAKGLTQVSSAADHSPVRLCLGVSFSSSVISISLTFDGSA